MTGQGEVAEAGSKRVLVIRYSQTGQLRDITEEVIRPLRAGGIDVTVAELKPLQPYAFPWSFWGFFNTFPECIYADPDPIELVEVEGDFDLVILAYQVWFLSPSLPVTAFLQRDAVRLLKGKPVITLIACRNMWLQAQEQVKEYLDQAGAQLIDNIVLTERTHGAISVITTPTWLLSGKRGPYLGGMLPRAGVWQSDVQDAARFGKAIAAQLPHRRAVAAACARRCHADAAWPVGGHRASWAHHLRSHRPPQLHAVGQVAARLRWPVCAAAPAGAGSIYSVPGGHAADGGAGGVHIEDTAVAADARAHRAAAAVFRGTLGRIRRAHGNPSNERGLHHRHLRGAAQCAGHQRPDGAHPRPAGRQAFACAARLSCAAMAS